MDPNRRKVLLGAGLLAATPAGYAQQPAKSKALTPVRCAPTRTEELLDGLIGRADGLRSLPTPALVLDTRALEHNLAKMQAAVRAQGLALRPHFKAHKSIQIARRQLPRDGGA